MTNRMLKRAGKDDEPIRAISVPDLWLVKDLLEDMEPPEAKAARWTLEAWHLAHDMKRQLQKDSALIEALETVETAARSELLSHGDFAALETALATLDAQRRTNDEDER